MVTATKMGGSQKGPKVGKVRRVNKSFATSPSGQFAKRLNQLLRNQPASDLADKLGVSDDAVLKWLRGDRTPPIDQWPDIAKALGLSDWRDLIPPK